jgi:hypothetical protein
MQVSSNWRPIEKVLSAGFYKVPRFQRAYSWDRSNVEDFWNDLVDNDEGYFIGSMVVYTNGDAYGLVDGQQRMTTITILLAALRNEFKRIGSDDDATGLQAAIERRDVRGAKNRFVLETETSYPYLQGQIQSEPDDARSQVAAGKEEKSLEAAFSYATNQIRSISNAVDSDQSVPEDKRKSEKGKRLSRLRDKVLSLSVVLVEVGDEDDATVIFQTLNSRGKDLETADLVKSHLFALLKPRNPSFDQVRDDWNSILRSFDDSAADLSMNRFLLHSWLSRQDYVGEKDLFKAIRSKVRTNNAREYLAELVGDADLYRIAQEPDYGQWQKGQREIRDALVALVTFRLRQPLPMVLALLRELKEKSLRPKIVLRGLRTIENYHFVATAVTNQPSSGGVSRMYAAAARSVLRAKTPNDKADAIQDLADKLRDRIPTYDEFEASFRELRSSREHTQQTPLVRYALRRLRAAASDQADVEELDLDALTIEHLVPQGGKRPEKVSADDVARLGNLLLVTKRLNEQLDDKPFTAKKKILLGKSVAESEILESGGWGATEIEARTRRLAKRAYEEVWTIP